MDPKIKIIILVLEFWFMLLNRTKFLVAKFGDCLNWFEHCLFVWISKQKLDLEKEKGFRKKKMEPDSTQPAAQQGPVPAHFHPPSANHFAPVNWPAEPMTGGPLPPLIPRWQQGPTQPAHSSSSSSR